jgi:hypothetical protein
MTESSSNAPTEWHRLFDAALNDTLDEAAATRLAELLRDNATARELWFLYHDNECALAELAAVEPVSRPSVRPTVQSKKSNSWLRQGSLAAAVAGLVVGLLSASLAWAYVGLQSRRAITLLQESFESGPAPLVSGVPIEPGYWSGDFSAIVSEQQAVKPASGEKMLRFLRGDYEGRSIPSSHSSDVFRLVDVRPYRREFADGGAVVQLSAVFNAAPFPEDENFSATLTIFALDASLVGTEMLKVENVLSTESLAFSRSTKVVMDRDPTTWQKVSNELRLPPGTDYLMLRMGMSNDTKSQDKRRDSFAGHFADKVQLVLARRSEIPVP